MATTERSLTSLLGDVHRGRIQVPEFQRPLLLRDAWVRSLLASVSLGYSIGAVMLLEAGNPDLRFDSRPLPGVPARSTVPEWYAIDGQYRLAALYQALTRAAPMQVLIDGESAVPRRYWLDADLAADPDVDRDEAIVSVDARESPGAPLIPLWRTFETASTLLEPTRQFVVPIIELPKESTRWSIRVHGGAAGPALSDRFRAAALDASSE